MTQVSKRQLKRQIEEKVYETFWETIGKLNKKEAELFFPEFFTKFEKVNFAKRLSIAVLLFKGYGWRSIADILKVSATTIGRMAAKVDTAGFKLYFAKIEREEGWRKFWQDLGKTYLRLIHPEKVAKLDDEGIERLYLGKKKTF